MIQVIVGCETDPVDLEFKVKFQDAPQPRKGGYELELT